MFRHEFNVNNERIGELKRKHFSIVDNGNCATGMAHRIVKTPKVMRLRRQRLLPN